MFIPSTGQLTGEHKHGREQPWGGRPQKVYSVQSLVGFPFLFFGSSHLLSRKKPFVSGALAAAAAAAAKSLQSCLTLCDPIDGSPLGSPVPGIFQARVLEWVAISFSNTNGLIWHK